MEIGQVGIVRGKLKVRWGVVGKLLAVHLPQFECCGCY